MDRQMSEPPESLSDESPKLKPTDSVNYSENHVKTNGDVAPPINDSLKQKVVNVNEETGSDIKSNEKIVNGTS